MNRKCIKCGLQFKADTLGDHYCEVCHKKYADMIDNNPDEMIEELADMFDEARRLFFEMDAPRNNSVRVVPLRRLDLGRWERLTDADRELMRQMGITAD